jgi:preprotein translocase subunit SecF
VFEIVKPGTQIDFIGRWKLCASLSLALILLSVAMIPVRGFRLGIDFAGGNEVQVRLADGQVGEGQLRSVVQGLGVEEVSVVRFGAEGEGDFLIRFRGDLPGASPEDRMAPLRVALGEQVGTVDVARVETVGPRVGGELRRDGLLALLWSFGAILVYIAFRFSVRFSPGAVLAVIHDVLVTSGLWVLLGFEFDLRVLAALLAIVGYSLNDTIIVYDRIRENLEMHTGVALREVLNRSVNQTLSRTLLTSGTTLLAVLALWALGGDVIRPFAIAMTIGIVVGTYSSIYIAAPTLLLLESRFGDNAPPTARSSKRAKARA